MPIWSDFLACQTSFLTHIPHRRRQPLPLKPASCGLYHLPQKHQPAVDTAALQNNPEKPALTGLTGCPLSSLRIPQQRSQRRRGDRLRRTESGPCHQHRHVRSTARGESSNLCVIQSPWQTLRTLGYESSAGSHFSSEPPRPTAQKSPLAFCLSLWLSFSPTCGEYNLQPA